MHFLIRAAQFGLVLKLPFGILCVMCFPTVKVLYSFPPPIVFS